MVGDEKNSEIKIGIVDDHSIFKSALRTALSFYHNLRVILEAENGSDLLIKLQSTQPDIILLDLEMSVMDGFTVLPKIKKYYPFIQVIILSLHNDKTLIDHLLKSGACSYLSKLDPPHHMYQQIKACVQHKFNFQLY